jgi:hypothetical protein
VGQTAEHLISDATQLGDLLALLRTRERAFVLLGPNVKGIITLADLNKPPVRVYLFGLMSLLEMHLRFWVHKFYPEESWKGQLKGDRLEAASKIQTERKGRNEEIGLLDCLQFCDKRDLLLANAEFLKTLDIASKGGFEKLLKKAEDLRNRLAHSQLDLVQGNVVACVHRGCRSYRKLRTQIRRLYRTDSQDHGHRL